LSAGVDALQDAAAAVEAGEAALGRGDARAALTHFEGADGFLTDELPRLAAGASAAREAIAASQELADRVRALIAEARAAEGRGRWAAVVELCAQALEIEPRRPDVLALMAKARAAAESEKQVQMRQLQKLMTQADKAIQQTQFADADRLLDEAQGFRINDEAVRIARARLNDARMAASAADARTRRAALELATARAMFDAADRKGALEKLQALADEDPDAPGVATEIRDMRAEIERLAADERRRVEASARAQEAAAYWEAGEVSKALQSADAALSLDRGQQAALRLQSLAKTRLREQTEAATRSAQAEARVAKARALLASGRFEKAEHEAQEALDLEPGRADAALVVADARRLEAEAEAERVRLDAAEHRERSVEKILKGAKKDLRAGNYDRAAWAAENALLIRPGHHQAQEILAQARSSLQANQRRPVDPDDTVRLPRNTQAEADPAATVIMPPNVGVPAGNSIGDWVWGLRRRLLASRGRTTPFGSRGGGPVRTR
jgi:tetratricopeptide (TPR) repeat protein